ncbi:MAG: hypothetical protein U9R38_04715 [Candidatus Margulisiibacteriota bacterium]|nr:hypothetical protein [Candidatus Margulisiibacteriota bacterium]
MRLGRMVRLASLIGVGFLAACGAKKAPKPVADSISKKDCNALIKKAQGTRPSPMTPTMATAASCKPTTLHAISVSVAPIIKRITRNGTRIEVLKGATQGQSFAGKILGISVQEIEQKANCKLSSPTALAQTGDLSISLGSGITVSNLTITNGVIRGDISISASATPGSRDLAVTIKGKTVTVKNYFRVVKKRTRVIRSGMTGMTGRTFVIDQ